MSDGSGVTPDRFQRRGYLVRLVHGMAAQCFALPGITEPRAWRFSYGVAVVDESLSDALQRAQELAARCAP